MTKLIDNTPVSVIPHPILNSTRCVVSSADLIEVEDKQILDHLSSQGVTAIRRIKRKIDGTEVNTPTIILTFGKTTYPQSVKVGILSVRTRPYYPNPMLCYGCFQYGHTKARCPGPARCGKCSSDNHAEPCENAEYCNNCKGDHRPSDRQCPMYKEETEVIKVKIDHNLPFLEARKPVSAGSKSYASTAAQPAQPSCEQNKIDAIFKMMTKKDEQMDKLIQAINEKDKELQKMKDYIAKLEHHIRSKQSNLSQQQATNTTIAQASQPTGSSKPNITMTSAAKKAHSAAVGNHTRRSSPANSTMNTDTLQNNPKRSRNLKTTTENNAICPAIYTVMQAGESPPPKRQIIKIDPINSQLNSDENVTIEDSDDDRESYNISVDQTMHLEEDSM
ncbi:uncharacterized protein LOC131677159 [Topomyia yanbarensis]|uniref:uncharacterized protein LOC131677159 n=1 Tax=Topomyia yanbarensis TaxID=2498891 RepID=UPI00273B3348|nr:uncharacterized protein LOC131677159 [Topomyia yanbarensis]